MALPPSIEDKYEILAKLSEGGMGAIYKVRHRLLDEIRVIKVVLRHAGPADELRDRFLGEARTASRLIHSNLARILDFLVDEQGQQLLVMEYIDGPTLQQVLSRLGPPPQGLALEIARQALDALGALHRAGFVHRDVAPDNLMLTRDAGAPGDRPLVKLIDFGIAKALAADPDRNPALTQTGIVLGKPRYASPEQLTGEPVDARSDLYSFGLVLYELLTGRCPFEGGSVRELITAHLQAEPLRFTVSDPEGQVPAGLRAIVLRLLAKHPEERFAGAAELAEALAPFAAPWPREAFEEILAEPASSAVSPERPLDVSHETRRSAEPAVPPLTALRHRVQPGVRVPPFAVALGLACVILLGLLAVWAVRTRSSGAATPKATPAVQQQPGAAAAPAPMLPVIPPSGDLAAQPLDQPQAIYPEKALAFGLPVRVTVDLTVDNRGRVVKAAAPFMDAEQPVPSNLFRPFRNAALEAARALHFQPATRAGKPVKEAVQLIIEVKP